MTQTLTRLDEANLPYLDLEDPAVAARPFERVRELARESWVARMPNGYLVLHWDDAKALNRHPMLRTPEGLGLAAQGIPDGRVYEWASGTVLGLGGRRTTASAAWPSPASRHRSSRRCARTPPGSSRRSSTASPPP